MSRAEITDFFFGFNIKRRGAKGGAPEIWFGIHLTLWERFGTSPLWIGIHKSIATDQLETELAKWENDRLSAGSRDRWFIPEKMSPINDEHSYLTVDLPINKPPQEVIDDIVQQLRRVAELAV